jgi:GPH family glycoside/pentoside/hexuronide:cation symporter
MIRTQLLYASGNMGKSSVASLFDIFALFYFTDVLGFSGIAAGNIILLSLIWDGLTDPWIAVITDKLRDKFTTVKIYFLVGVPATALFAVLFFHSGYIPEKYRYIFAVTSLFLFRTAYTIVDIPHNGLLSFIVNTPKDRTNVAGMRIFCSALGRALVTITSVHIIVGIAPNELNAQFGQASLLLALVFLCIMTLCLSSIKHIAIVHENEKLSSFKLSVITNELISNKPLAIVFAMSAISSLTTYTVSTAIIYFSKYGLNNESIGGMALTVMAFAQTVSLIFWVFFTNKLTDKALSAQFANGVLVIAMMLALLGMSSDKSLYIVCILTGIATSGISMLNWSLLPDVLDANSKSEGRRYDISVFGFFTLTNKICNGLAIAYVGWILSLFEYSANSKTAFEVIDQIIFFILITPFIGGIICFILLGKLRKDHRLILK